MRGWGLTVLRVMVGVVFVAHGFQTLTPLWGGQAVPTAAILASAGYAPDSGIVLAAGLVQSVGGLLLAVGGYTSIAALALGLERLASVWLLHLPQGFFLNWTLVPDVGHGTEYHAVMIAALVCLVVEGGGELSVDAVRSRRAEAEARGRARLRSRKLP